MTAWVACRRATLLVPSGPLHDPGRKHLHVVLTDPAVDGSGALVLVVSICSIPDSKIYDPSCTLFPGEHPFISRHSYVAYNFAQLVDATQLEAKVAAGQFAAKPLMDEKVFRHITEGLMDSPQTALRYKKWLSLRT